MKIRSVVVLVGLAISFTLPIFAQQTNTSDPQLREQLDAFNKIADEAFNNNDAAAVGALFTEDAVLVTESGPVYGREAIEKFYADVFKKFHFRNHVTKTDQNSLRVIDTAGNAICENGKWSVTLQGQNTPPIPLNGYYSEVDIREGDAWKQRIQAYNVSTQLASTGTAKPSPTTTPRSVVNAGQVLAFSFQSTTLGRDWDYTVYLPDGYDKSNLRYPVLFLLHGLSEDESTWVSRGNINAVADQLIAAGNISPVLLVMPGSGDNWYVDNKEKIETAFINDLIPEIERKFRILPEREGRGIGGDSMGGYGAFRFILKYPERFSVALLLAPSIFVPEPPANSHARQGDVFGNPFDAEIWKRDNYPPLLDPFFAKSLPIALYFVAGDHDDYEIESQIGPVYKIMRERHFDVAMRIVSGVHDFSTWRPELPDALRFVCRKLSRPELTSGEQVQPGK